MSGPFKMKGSPMARNFGVNPIKKVKETRTATTITKSKGDKSSTYTMNPSKTTENKDGSKNYTFTNKQGNSIRETHGSKRNKEASQ
tara:strand:- start:50 stop:307 length:258 start_codon:yes stop_codon:yes gene_type:complete